MTTEVLSARGSARALTRCRRSQLPESGFPAGGPPLAFLRALSAQDRDLEPYWHPIRERWVLYRVVRKGVVPSEDVMMKEFEVVGPRGEYRPLGMWLIDWLRLNDKTEGGAIDPTQANRATLRRLDAEDEAFEKGKEKQIDVISTQFKKDMETHVVRSRTSTVMPKTRRTE